MVYKMTTQIQYRWISDLYMPTRRTRHSAGLDVRCDFSRKELIRPNVYKVPIGVFLEKCDPTMHLEICIRSSMALDDIYLVNSIAVIDADYSAEICLLLHITEDQIAKYKTHYIAQILERLSYDGSNMPYLKTVARTGGFGSTDQ